MVQNPPQGTQRVVPYMIYADASSAVDFLCRAFGFKERFRLPGDDGKLMHAELEMQDCVIMLADVPEGMGYASPKDLDALHCSLLVYVDDVDGHHDQAKAAGAVIIQPLEDQFYGDRTYRARDPEGNEWSFATHVKDIAPEDLKIPGM